MGKQWRKYRVGIYRLGRINAQAVVRWDGENGKPQRRVLGTGLSEVEARAALDTFARRVAVIKAQSAATVDELWAAYYADRERDGKLMGPFRDSWKVLKGRFGNLPVDAVNADVCRDHAQARHTAGVSAGTIWTELTRLRSCLNWAQKRRVIREAPYVWVPRKPAPRDIVLTEEQVGALIDACVMPHMRLFVILAITTAARSGAILALTWDRVDLERGHIDLREPTMVNPLTKKARKHRALVPITPEARAALQTARDGALTNYVIEWNENVRKDGTVGPLLKIRKGFEMAVKRAGLPAGVTPHVLRHTAASWMESEGVAMERIARLLGHRDPATTRKVYAKPEVESLRSAANVIDMRLQKVRKGQRGDS